MDACVAPPPPLLDVRAQNSGKADWEISEIYAYGAGLRSLYSLIGLSQFSNLKVLSLHGNQLERIEGLDRLQNLAELNLSSNNICKMEGLSQLSALKVLNLSSNRLTEIVGIEALVALKKLLLSHNRIVLLGGLSALHGPRFSLQYLDLRDNLVCSLSELWVLAGCMHLRELVLGIGKHQNPVCQNADYQRSVIAALPHLQSLDGHVLAPMSQSGLRTRVDDGRDILCRESAIVDHVSNVLLPALPKVVVGQEDPVVPHRQSDMTPQDPVNLRELNWQRPVQQQPPTQGCNVFLVPLLNQPQSQVSFQASSKENLPTSGFYQQDMQRQHVSPHVEMQLGPPAAAWRPPSNWSAGKDSGWLPLPHVDHTLNGFHRRKHFRQAVALEGPEDDQAKSIHYAVVEERVGMLESRVLDLVEELAMSQVRRGPYRRRVAHHHGSVDMDSPSGGDTDRVEPQKRKHAVSMRRSMEEHDARAKGKQTLGLTGHNCLPRKRPLDPLAKKGLVCDYEWVGKMDTATQTSLWKEPNIEQICREIQQLQLNLANMVARPSGGADEQQLVDMVSHGHGSRGVTSCNRAIEKQPVGTVDKFLLERLQQADIENNTIISELKKKMEEKGAEVQRLKDSVHRMEALVAEKHQLGAAVQERINSELISAQEQVVSLKQELAVVNRLHGNAEKCLKELAAEMNNVKESAAAKARALDEQAASLKSAEKELEVCRLKEAAARKELKLVISRMDSSRVEQLKQLERLKVSYEEQSREHLSQQLAAAESKAKVAAEKALNTLKDHLQAKLYNVENQLRQALQENESMCQRVKEIQEKTSREASELKQALKTVLLKERRAEALVGELTGVVQSQKAKLQSAHQELKGLPAAQEELRALRDEVGTLRSRASKSEDLARELEGLKCQVAEASLLAHAESDNVLKELRLQLDSFKGENKRLTAEAAACLEKLQAAEDAVRVKTKMLDSQNETIKDLKSELKEAHRESKIIADTVESKWHERMRDDLEQGLALRKELAAHEKTIYELERQLKLEKAASKTIEQANSALQKKIAEKDGMLRYVEEEVARVKGLYESREKALATERDKVLEQLKSAAKEKEDAVAKAMAEARIQQRELSDLNHTLEARERQLTSALAAKEDDIAAFSRKLVEAESELQRQVQATQKSKILSSTKVNQLCKVLEELREVT